MIKALFKLLLIIVALYLLMQIPFIRQHADSLKAAIFDKVGNVTEEYERVKGKVDETKDTVNELKDKAINFKEGVDEFTDQALQTGAALKESAEKLNKAIKVFADDEKEGEPAEEPTEEEVPDSQ
ncbi:MAG: hypothetical protein V1760_00140 [Candidatus Peregrinibacteria bacterium]